MTKSISYFKMVHMENASYIAGFFDGEGCITTQGQPGKSTTVKLTLAQKHRDILDWIHEILGIGKVYYYPNSITKSGHQRAPRLIIFLKEEQLFFISTVLPYIKIKKRELELLRIYLELGERNPEIRKELIQQIRDTKKDPYHYK